MSALTLVRPDWPVPAAVQACTTTRDGGVSTSTFASLNLGDHVGDAPAAVAENRQRLTRELALPHAPAWPRQVHGCTVVDAQAADGAEADAVFSLRPGQVCGVLTADCLPVLFCDTGATRVAAAHAGWRGLAAGVLEASVAALECDPASLLAWLGPAIGPAAFQVGDEVRAAFMAHDPDAALAFVADGPGHWRADIYALARQRLARCGVQQVYGGGLCTYDDEVRFFSYRRDARTGRMASLVWLQAD